MNQSFSEIMDSAIKRCEGMYIADISSKHCFNLIYPFTTENISGYINEFNLVNKSLLTVGSSGDQVINAILHGCKDITVVDINPYTRFYYYLKIAGILSLDIDEFLSFFRFKDYPNVFKDNKFVFNESTYNKLSHLLRLLDYESYLFWEELFCNFKRKDIRDNLFSRDEDRTYVITSCNPYLQSKVSYKEVKSKLKHITPTFIHGDLFKLNIYKKFDNIWLSNIASYLSADEIKTLIDKYAHSLGDKGNLLISYLYKTTKDSKYQEEWSPIYNLENIYRILKEYSPNLISFKGIDGLKFNSSKMKDSVLIYQKK